jgi:hypothetical protein
MSDVFTIVFVVLWLVFFGMMARSVWLISWKYLAALFIVYSACFAMAISAYHESVSDVAMFVYGYLFVGYVIYYKYTMGEGALDPIRPALLIKKSRKEKLPGAWLFIYMPHALFFILIVWIVLIYVLPDGIIE